MSVSIEDAKKIALNEAKDGEIILGAEESTTHYLFTIGDKSRKQIFPPPPGGTFSVAVNKKAGKKEVVFPYELRFFELYENVKPIDIE